MKRSLLLLSIALAAALPSCNSEQKREQRARGRHAIYMTGLRFASTEGQVLRDRYFREAHMVSVANRDALFAEYAKWLTQAEMDEAFERGRRFDYYTQDVNSEIRRLVALP